MSPYYDQQPPVGQWSTVRPVDPRTQNRRVALQAASTAFSGIAAVEPERVLRRAEFYEDWLNRPYEKQENP